MRLFVETFCPKLRYINFKKFITFIRYSTIEQLSYKVFTLWRYYFYKTLKINVPSHYNCKNNSWLEIELTCTEWYQYKSFLITYFVNFTWILKE